MSDRPATTLSLFAYAALTDLLDGGVARYCNQRSVVGTVLDPMADKTLMTVAVVCLTAQGGLPCEFQASFPQKYSSLLTITTTTTSLARDADSRAGHRAGGIGAVFPVGQPAGAEDDGAVLGFFAAERRGAANGDLEGEYAAAAAACFRGYRAARAAGAAGAAGGLG